MKTICLFLLLTIGHAMVGDASHYGKGLSPIFNKETGKWYNFHYGASGIMVHKDDPVAAHKTLPFGTIVKVTNRKNGESTTVVIFDRGPYVAGRVIDMQPYSLWDIAGKGAGGCSVRLEIVSSEWACNSYKCLSKSLGKKRITDDVLKEMLLGRE